MTVANYGGRSALNPPHPGVGDVPVRDEPRRRQQHEAAPRLGHHTKPAWFLAHRIREAWSDFTEASDRYVREFSGRYHVRERDTIDRMSTLARGMAGKRLAYRDPIAG